MTEFKDFLIDDRATGLVTIDVPKIEKLSEEEFRKIYTAEMEHFVKYHGKNPRCGRCFGIVESSKDLIRYFGANLHHNCFKEEYQNDKTGLRENERRYFDLVAKMVRGAVNGTRR